MSGEESRARALLDRHIAAWNEGDWEALERLYEPDAVVHGRYFRDHSDARAEFDS